MYELLVVVLDCLDPMLIEKANMNTLRHLGKIKTISTYQETKPAVQSLLDKDTKLWNKIDCKWGICNIPYLGSFNINGWIIGGYFVSNMNKLTHPPELQEILDRFNYKVDIPKISEWLDAHIEYPKIVPNRTITFNYLLNEYPVNIAIIWYRSGDGITHYHSFYTKEESKIVEYYDYLDQQVSNIDLDRFHNVLVFSDHGVPTYGGLYSKLSNLPHRPYGFFVSKPDIDINHFSEIHDIIVKIGREYNFGSIDKEYVYSQVEEEKIIERLKNMGYY